MTAGSNASAVGHRRQWESLGDGLGPARSSRPAPAQRRLARYASAASRGSADDRLLHSGWNSWVAVFRSRGRWRGTHRHPEHRVGRARPPRACHASRGARDDRRRPLRADRGQTECPARGLGERPQRRHPTYRTQPPLTSGPRLLRRRRRARVAVPDIAGTPDRGVRAGAQHRHNLAGARRLHAVAPQRAAAAGRHGGGRTRWSRAVARCCAGTRSCRGAPTRRPARSHCSAVRHCCASRTSRPWARRSPRASSRRSSVSVRAPSGSGYVIKAGRQPGTHGGISRRSKPAE